MAADRRCDSGDERGRRAAEGEAEGLFHLGGGSGAGGFGDGQATDGTWTAVLNSDSGDPATASCNSPKHLYCIEY